MSAMSGKKLRWRPRNAGVTLLRERAFEGSRLGDKSSGGVCYSRELHLLSFRPVVRTRTCVPPKVLRAFLTNCCGGRSIDDGGEPTCVESFSRCFPWRCLYALGRKLRHLPLGLAQGSGGGTTPAVRATLASGRWAANLGSQRRTAWRTPRSIAASRRTSWPRGRRCGRWELAENRGQAVSLLRIGSMSNAPRLLQCLDVEETQRTQMVRY